MAILCHFNAQKLPLITGRPPLVADLLLVTVVAGWQWSLVGGGKFVAEAMCVIAANTNVPVSVKCTIGLDDHDLYNELCKLFKLSVPHRK
ncbi:hypothetical protein MTR67_004190 [Solanum verrucosum]|uniref:Uncharacterized protein n=1 Tax=Solanum verrucosum TaxID=315347 RepID=A0AAF0PVQ7_SOLVR|nr:hypothetical protein MTR67_004190 [Solanum verrucosum]